MTKDEALRLALEALKNLIPIGKRTADLQTQAITAVEAALEAKDEPVAWMYDWIRHDGEFIQDWTTSDAESLRDTEPTIITNVRPLYTTPPQRTWVGLTDEEFKDAINDKLTPECIAIAIEAKLKEKNS